MRSQSDKFRKDAKMIEMEDELRRRREQMQNGHQSPVNGIRVTAGVSTINGARTGPSNGHASPSTERGDIRHVNGTHGNGKPPTEKRVQWAIDSPKKSSSPSVKNPPTHQLIENFFDNSFDWLIDWLHIDWVNTRLIDWLIDFLQSSQRSSPTGPIRKEPISSLTQPGRSHTVLRPNGHAQSPIPVHQTPAQPNWARAEAVLRGDQSSSNDDHSSSASSAQTIWNPDDYQQAKLWKQSEMRRFRDEEIASLESRLPSGDLAPNERERLRILRLERDFERRAAETRNRGYDEEDPDNDGEQDEEEEEEGNGGSPVVPPTAVKLPVTKPTPHLHHPAAAAGPDVYKTRQQEDYDSFVRRHEIHAVNEHIRKSREHLDKVPIVRFQEPQVRKIPEKSSFLKCTIMISAEKLFQKPKCV